MTSAGGFSAVATTRLDGRVSLITGAAGGLGRAVVVSLAANGADVCITDVPGQRDVLEDLASDILKRFGRRVLILTGDVSLRPDVDVIVQGALSGLGRIDNVINCAGYFRHDLMLDRVTDTEWQRLLAVNLDAVRHLAAAVTPSMITQGSGAFVAVASDSAFEASPGEAPYGIAKMGAIRMMAYLAREYAHSGLRFNAIAPGWIRTAMTEAFWSDPDLAAQAVSSVPAGRFAEPEEIAGVILFLVSGLSSYVNGHCVICDGGRLAGIPA